MGKIRQGGFIFISWKGDHSPRHVHVFKDGREILKFNLDDWVVMKGTLSKRVRKILEQLAKEGKL